MNAELIPIRTKAIEVLNVIKQLRFRRLNEDTYVLKGTLKDDEMDLVKDLLVLDKERAVYITKEPEEVIKRLLSQKKIMLDVIFATKIIGAVKLNREDLLYFLTMAYKSLVINAPHEKKRDLIRRARFRGDLFDFTKQRPSDWVIDSFSTFKSKEGSRYFSKVIWKDSTGHRFVQVGGKTAFDDEWRFPNYIMIWEEEDVKDFSDKDLFSLLMTGYYADNIAMTIGKVLKSYDLGDKDFGFNGILASIIDYNVVKDDFYKSYLVNLVEYINGSRMTVVTQEFKEEEEATRFLEGELLPKIKKALEEFENFVKGSDFNLQPMQGSEDSNKDSDNQIYL